MKKPDSPDTPWDIEIDSLHRSQQISFEHAADRVAIGWLIDGDTRALADLLLRGHVPGPALLGFIGQMLLGPDIAKDLPPDLSKRAPFQLVAKPRTRRAGRSPDRAMKVRDILLAGQMHGLRKAGLTYEAAITRLEEVGTDTGAGVGRKTIERAVSKRSRQKPRI